jgi:hypothetical protein
MTAFATAQPTGSARLRSPLLALLATVAIHPHTPVGPGVPISDSTWPLPSFAGFGVAWRYRSGLRRH